MPSDYIDIAGQLALDFTNWQAVLRARENPTFTDADEDRLNIMADKLAVVISKGLGSAERPTHLPLGYLVDELAYLSLGYSERERAKDQGITLYSVKSRLKRIKSLLGTRTRPQTVAEGIQQGYIPIRLRTDPSYEPLTWMQQTILSYSAAGWTAAEVGDYYNISSNTVDRHYEDIRYKLGAHNMPSAVRRAFEIGVFKVGEPIDEAAGLGLEARIWTPSAAKELEPLTIKDPRQTELLRIMAEQKTGWISSQMALEAGFYEGVADISRKSEFGRMMQDLAFRLETATGKAQISKKKIRIDGKRTYIYALKEGLLIDIDGGKEIIPAYPEELRKIEIAERVKAGARKPRKRRTKSKPKTTSEAKKPAPVIASKPELSPETTAELVELLELSPLDESLLSNLGARPPDEVLENTSIKNSVDYVGRQNLAHDYKTKLMMALRYGIPSESISLTSISRGGESINLAEICSYIPIYQGLDLESASRVSGLSPLELLQIEFKFISEFKQRFPGLEQLEPKVREAIRQLKKS